MNTGTRKAIDRLPVITDRKQSGVVSLISASPIEMRLRGDILKLIHKNMTEWALELATSPHNTAARNTTYLSNR
jgi:hypothetical protein